MSELNSSIYTGLVMHHRFKPKKHRFIYRVFSLCVDLDELSTLDKKLKLFSINRFNLFSFHEKDHGRSDRNLKKHIREILCDHGYGEATAKIKLLCYPRILGYVFNPLSVYFCYNQQQQLNVILYEVSNTFGRRHTYILPVKDTQSSAARQHCLKRMYVSPFMPMETYYSFRIQPPRKKISVCIRQGHHKGLHGRSGTILNALFTGNKQVLSDTQLFKLFLCYPLMTFKVIAAIHWEAIRLWFKGLRPQPRDTNEPKYSLSWDDKNGVAQYETL